MRISGYERLDEITGEKLSLKPGYSMFIDVDDKLEHPENSSILTELFNVLLESLKEKHPLGDRSKRIATKIIDVISPETIFEQPLENFKGIYKQLRATKLLKLFVEKGKISPKLAAMYKPELSLPSIEEKLEPLKKHPCFNQAADILSKYMYSGKVKLPDENLEEIVPLVSELAKVYLREKKAEKFVTAAQEAKRHPTGMLSLASFNKEGLSNLAACPNLKKLKIPFKKFMEIDSIRIFKKILHKGVELKISNIRHVDLPSGKFSLRLSILKQFCDKSPQVKLKKPPRNYKDKIQCLLESLSSGVLPDKCLKIAVLSDFKELEHSDSKYLKELSIECWTPLNTYACDLLKRLSVEKLSFYPATAFTPSESGLNFLLDMPRLKTLFLPLGVVLKLPSTAVDVLQQLHVKGVKWIFDYRQDCFNYRNLQTQLEPITTLLKYAQETGNTHLQQVLNGKI